MGTMLEHMAEIMEAAKLELTGKGNLLMRAVVTLAQDCEETITLPMDESIGDRVAAKMALQLFILVAKPHRVVVVSEAWSKTVADNELPVGDLADDPEATEIIVLAGWENDHISMLTQKFHHEGDTIVFDGVPIPETEGIESSFFPKKKGGE